MAKNSSYTIKAEATSLGWIDGSINGFRFQAKVYDEGSEYGINKGRVSKLMIWDENTRQASNNIFKASILNYDRGWDIKPKKAADRHLMEALLEYLEKLPITTACEMLED